MSLFPYRVWVDWVGGQAPCFNPFSACCCCRGGIHKTILTFMLIIKEMQFAIKNRNQDKPVVNVGAKLVAYVCTVNKDNWASTNDWCLFFTAFNIIFQQKDHCFQNMTPWAVFFLQLHTTKFSSLVSITHNNLQLKHTCV